MSLYKELVKDPMLKFHGLRGNLTKQNLHFAAFIVFCIIKQ